MVIGVVGGESEFPYRSTQVNFCERGHRSLLFREGFLFVQPTNQPTNQPNSTDPTQPNPTQPNRTQPTQPNPTQPNPTQPNPTQPNPTQPNPTDHLNQRLIMARVAATSRSNTHKRDSRGSKRPPVKTDKTIPKAIKKTQTRKPKTPSPSHSPTPPPSPPPQSEHPSEEEIASDHDDDLGINFSEDDPKAQDEHLPAINPLIDSMDQEFRQQNPGYQFDQDTPDRSMEDPDHPCCIVPTSELAKLRAMMNLDDEHYEQALQILNAWRPDFFPRNERIGTAPREIKRPGQIVRPPIGHQLKLKDSGAAIPQEFRV
ncbi:hypothetical protein Pst134EA_004676 [Puccinia striiformis f. sp. tritici]|uniref:hypothetical protein n=1 Tax=Puccinia striiformis f. sp. tritici TaxID=168172 RepID=UPI002008B314|nr:hypothetical protein Pst134EA_004676 [Puccinia striiformis f. sp. tritici]KAH9470751.1 hypothetical protein Pst134EA_004676 [Puccinia striiformis f. sp. tritici]